MSELQAILKKAKKAAESVNILEHSKRQELLENLASGLRENTDMILEANAKDVAEFDENDPMRDRLLLTAERIDGMAQEIESVMSLSDPIGEEYDERERHNLTIRRRKVPFGVVGVVYESRPNVTTDVTGICLKSGNVVILKGGPEAKHSYQALMDVIAGVLREAGVDEHAVQMIDPEKLELVKDLLQAEGYVDLAIPRGSQRFIEFVRETAKVPVIETGAGVCHAFVDDTADLHKSADIIFNAKTQRPSVCNALDTALLHESVYADILPLMAEQLKTMEVEIFADSKSYEVLKDVYPTELLQEAQESDFGREFLSQKMSVKVVSDVTEAIKHVNTYSSKHSESILSNTKQHLELFQKLVDAAVVYANASTRFSDGNMFGLGSEIGNSTQKLHARGPMGPAEITTYKWIVDGDYTVRS